VQHVLGPVATLVVAALLLVLVGALPALPALARGSARARLAAIVPIVAFGFGAAGVWRAFERGLVLPGGFPARVVKYAATELNAASEPIVLVIDGGSYVAHGVDAKYLMDELKKHHCDVRVVRLAAAAANHFERYRMAEQVVQRLSPRKPGQRWVYLAEVHLGYDSRPLTQFTENLDTMRSYQYTTLPNAWAAVRALQSPGVYAPDAWRWSLFRHTLINALNVGATSRFVPEAEVLLTGGRVSPLRRYKFRFRGMARQLASLDEPVVGAMLPWLAQVREARTRRLWRPYTSELVYFGLPSTSLEQLSYVREFCAATRHKCIAPADAKLLRALDHAALWSDQGHMMPRAAEIYSRWLARQLVAQRVVTH
jgi:hypothetical protein